MNKRIAQFIIPSFETIEGAGVKLRRAFGNVDLAYITDPFLLLDDFGSRYPHEYLAGFPWHPHRGFETVTYLIKGEVHHEDSTGIKGVIRTGDLQWMTAGSGIFHSEMPKPAKKKVEDKEEEDPEVRGFQLWVNLPSSSKFVIPKYRNLQREAMPSVTLDNGAVVRLVSGKLERIPGYGSVEGPVKDLIVDIDYLDVSIPPNETFSYKVKNLYTVLAYVVEGNVIVQKLNNEVDVGEKKTILFNKEGNLVSIKAAEKGARILLLSGRPIEEPIAWYGPIVMNTYDEIEKAFEELRNNTFVKHKATEYDYFKG